MRIQKLTYGIITVFLLLILRLSFITLGGEQLKKEAFAQQTSNSYANKCVYDCDMREISNTGLMSHLLGYNWNGGAYGTKRILKELSFDQEQNLFEITDAKGKTVSYAKKGNDYSGIKLTVNYHIQKIAEEVMDNYELTGAVVVVDANTGGISAMASRPDFDNDNVKQYFDSGNGELINRATSQYNLGSIFKIVTASAALQTSYSYEYLYNCTGKVNIDARDFLCNKEEGHGLITFNQGMAYSCNCLFYDLGIKLGYENIKKYAMDFGFGEQVLKINSFDESRGNLPTEVLSNQGLANVSIGQGEILATPLQVADMMCTIANDGIRKQLMLIGGIVGNDGNATEIQPTDTGRIISVDTARNIKQMLLEAVEYGTGVSAKPNNSTAVGKTGTAETGWAKDGQTMTHGWFAGYFPAENPEYVCVVLAENGGYGSDSASPVFKEIAKKILDL